MKFKNGLMVILFLSFFCEFARAADPQLILSQLKLPPGFKISVFAANIPNARGMTLGDNGVIFVGSGAISSHNLDGKVYALQDADRDGKAEKVWVIARGLDQPAGLAYNKQDGALYVTATTRILKYSNIMKRLANPPSPTVIYSKFPTHRSHSWKYLRFGPDGKLYTSIGAPCNICDPQKPFASLVRLNKDGSSFEVIASGIRNSVGFDWQPGTDSLFFTDNGRDWLGNTIPPEELNRWSGKVGQHFGYPYCHAGYIKDPDYGNLHGCNEFTPPIWQFRAHNAPLGMRFYRGNKFPAVYKKRVFVALHGSWNRTPAEGHRVVMLELNGAQVTYVKNIVEGWLTPDRKVLGRPVDILELDDGSVLISDDYANLIYRLDYTG